MLRNKLSTFNENYHIVMVFSLETSESRPETPRPNPTKPEIEHTGTTQQLGKEEPSPGATNDDTEPGSKITADQNLECLP